MKYVEAWTAVIAMDGVIVHPRTPNAVCGVGPFDAQRQRGSVCMIKQLPISRPTTCLLLIWPEVGERFRARRLLGRRKLEQGRPTERRSRSKEKKERAQGVCFGGRWDFRFLYSLISTVSSIYFCFRVWIDLIWRFESWFRLRFGSFRSFIWLLCFVYKRIVLSF